MRSPPPPDGLLPRAFSARCHLLGGTFPQPQRYDGRKQLMIARKQDRKDQAARALAAAGLRNCNPPIPLWEGQGLVRPFHCFVSFAAAQEAVVQISSVNAGVATPSQ